MRPSEIKLAEMIIEKYSNSKEKYQEQTKYKSLVDFLNAMENEGGVAVQKAFSQKTLAEFGRLHAAFEFSNDFGAPFERVEVVSYLRLTSEQLVDIKKLASDEKKGLKASISELNESTFKTLAAVLSSPTRSNLEQNFDGVWKLDSWHY